jgi:hypothetical protein
VPSIGRGLGEVLLCPRTLLAKFVTVSHKLESGY